MRNIVSVRPASIIARRVGLACIVILAGCGADGVVSPTPPIYDPYVPPSVDASAPDASMPAPDAPPAPGREEACNGRDDNGNGEVDETFQCGGSRASLGRTVCGVECSQTCNPVTCIWSSACTVGTLPVGQDLVTAVTSRGHCATLTLGPANYNAYFNWSFGSRTVKGEVRDLDDLDGQRNPVVLGDVVATAGCVRPWDSPRGTISFRVSDAARCHRIELCMREHDGGGFCSYGGGANFHGLSLERTAQYTSADP